MAKSNQFDAMVSYFNSLLTDAPTPKVQDKKVPNAARPTLDVDKEQESKTATLERLIAHVKPAEEALETKVLPEVKTQIQTEVETKVESNVETQVETQTELQTKTQDEVAATIRVDTKVQEEAAQASSAPQAPAWRMDWSQCGPLSTTHPCPPSTKPRHATESPSRPSQPFPFRGARPQATANRSRLPPRNFPAAYAASKARLSWSLCRATKGPWPSPCTVVRFRRCTVLL